MPDAQRYDGWTPEKQKRFLTALSRGHNVKQACAIVGMSRQTAYALRNSARGAAFARDDLVTVARHQSHPAPTSPIV